MSLAARRKTFKSEALYMFSEYSKEQKIYKTERFSHTELFKCVIIVGQIVEGLG